MSIHAPTYGPVNRPLMERLAQLPAAQDGPFFMLNLMRYRPVAVYEDGRASTLTGKEADDTYAPLDILADLGAEVVLFGDVAEQLRGAPQWERVAMVRYPTVASFLAMHERPDFIDRHVHKDAGMESTVIALCTPWAGSLQESPRLLVDLLAGVPPESVVAGPGEAVLRVDGTLVGERTSWTVLRLRPAEPAAHLPALAGAATTVTLAPLIDTLPRWLSIPTA